MQKSNKTALLLLSLCGTLAAASDPLYIGLQAGYTDHTFSKSSILLADGSAVTSASISNHVFSLRAYSGYQFSEFFSSEIGYLKLRDINFSNINASSTINDSILMYGVDVRGKISLPMASYIRFVPYMQFGSVHLATKVMRARINAAQGSFGETINPLFGAGIKYKFSNQLRADLSWTAITKRQTNIPRLNVFLVGFEYSLDVKSTDNVNFNYGGLS